MDTIVMIRKNTIKSKLIREKRPAKTIYDECANKFIPETEACPCCGCRGSLSVFAYYDRTVIDFIEGRPQTVSFCIHRYVCSSCKHPTTHALITDPIIPYCRHSLFFVLRVLAERALRLRSVDRICDTYDVSRRTFYRWLRLYEDHRREWQGLLSSMETSLRDSILEIVRKNDPFSSFALSFFKGTGLTFLQSHQNPAHSRRRQAEPRQDFPFPHNSS